MDMMDVCDIETSGLMELKELWFQSIGVQWKICLQESALVQPGLRVCPPGPCGYFASPSTPTCNQSQRMSLVCVYLILLSEQCESASDRWKLSIGQSEKVISRVRCQCLHADNCSHNPPPPPPPTLCCNVLVV